jgi:hypothetical protein
MLRFEASAVPLERAGRLRLQLSLRTGRARRSARGAVVATSFLPAEAVHAYPAGRDRWRRNGRADTCRRRIVGPVRSESAAKAKEVVLARVDGDLPSRDGAVRLPLPCGETTSSSVTGQMRSKPRSSRSAHRDASGLLDSRTSADLSISQVVTPRPRA